ncbi:MAG: 6-carboxytetrahydropterin synthase QueD [Chloroflexi bacterium]|jgi:6-pyruvoyltetrahydropterin/6-carboxytetrahydropterin synthase|nr:6-carboxytetrahydropterin synthase QueD [Chloroflexota bacterium]MBT7080406.1 6-carboxytetrahydropterin synthase QueD [Chloroflexota bacterium]MBT7289237.1 6-carboxytetrahydropterin synthase QueD [Chloroflexota bacterium]
MYKIIKSFTISAAHHLDLTYDSPCAKTHGHNYVITVYCQSEKLDSNGMVVDFDEIKSLVGDVLDHKNLNDVLDFNPTAENVAKWIVDQVKTAYRCDVQESDGSIAIYEL